MKPLTNIYVYLSMFLAAVLLAFMTITVAYECIKVFL
jgi:hypothetical protein